MNMGFPDVCMTPAGPAVVPVPYPNIAMNAQATPFSPVVKVSGMNALNMASKIPMTSGDEGGTAHPMFKQMGAYTMGNPIVSIDQMPAINLCCPTTGNNMNNALGAVLVPSAVNVFYCDRATGLAEGAALDAEALAAIPASLHDVAPIGAPVLLPGGVALLAIARFTADLPARAHDAIRRIEARGGRALILDLRGAPGGELDAFLRLAGDFLPRGTTIATVVDGDGDETAHHATHDDPCTLPLVLLVDRATASAAELFAGCLQAHQRAVVVGERTYGKMTAQTIVSGPDGVRYVTAARCRIDASDAEAVTPDIDIHGEATADLETDAPLLAALRIAIELEM
ncbi:carboxyl-terminal processing protease [Minicystis rosea]|nr:carboxyl-terminal processing protease [Minicystis rosea]